MLTTFSKAYFFLTKISGRHAKSFKAPSFFGGINLSDHANYWQFGYSALMITNTAFYRNEYYHTKGDKLNRLDIPRMALVIDGVYRSLIAIE
jgi:hypothetical protein